MSVSDLSRQAELFASELDELIRGCLPMDPNLRIGAILGATNRVAIRPMTPEGEPLPIPLHLGGVHVANFELQIQAMEHPELKYLKTRKSNFVLKSLLENEPLVRLEYDIELGTSPLAHWQFHAERGVFSYLLGQAGATSKLVTDQPWRLSKLHFPVGGERFRPGVEDFIEFLIRECGFDSSQTWNSQVRIGRERMRRFQLQNVIREQQNLAADFLEEFGWTVSPPANGQRGATTLNHHW